MKLLKKLSVLLVAFAMVFTLIPSVAFADDEAAEGETSQYVDGYYTTVVNTNKEDYGYVTDADGNITQYGFSYPKSNYDLPVTIQIQDGKIVDVAYPNRVSDIVANTSSDINYLMWAMDGHNVTEASYNYLAKPNGNYEKYHVNPPMNGKGIREQILEKQSTEGIDTVTAATITSRAIINSVTQSLEKAVNGEKDDPEPVLPTPDTTKAVIPYDGVYFASDVACIGASVDNYVAPMILYVRNGKITADMAMEQRQTSYPYIFAGTEAEALEAGEEGWLYPVDYDYGYTAYGSLYHNVPVASLDKPLNYVMFAKGSGNWFNRLITIDSSKITKVPYGDYEADEFTFDGGSGRVTITCDKVHVTKKGITFDVAFSSNKYTKLVVNGVEYAPVIKGDKAVFESVPLNINGQTAITGTTVAMSSPQDIEYSVTVKFDAEELKPIEKVYQDGFYTSTIRTDKASYGWKANKDGTIQQGLSYPSSDYEFPLTVEIRDGKIVDVAYTRDPNAIMMNTSSDFNYLLWAMNGHYVNDYNYGYLADGGNYESYHLNPFPVKNGKGIREQVIANNGTNDVDTVTAATLTSKAIIAGVDLCLEKAEKGEKDDPEPVLPTPDTSDDIIPEDGYYTIEGKCVGASLSGDYPVELTVKNGKIKAVVRIEQRQTSYPYIFAGTETEALEAGEAGWLIPEDYDYGYKYPGSLYSNVPIKSLDKPLHFVMYARGSGNWFNRLITLDSATLVKTGEAEYGPADIVEMIDMLPSEITLESEEQIARAREYYEKLTEEEKAQVPEAEVVKLELAESKLEALISKSEAEQANKDKEAAEQAAKEAQEAQEAAEQAAKEAQEAQEAAEQAAQESKEKQEAAEQEAREAQAKLEESEKALQEAQAKLEAAEKAAKEAKIAQKKAEAKNYTVSGLKVTSKNRKFTVKYKKNKKATGYQIQYKLKTASKWSTLKKTTKLSATSKKLKKGKVYKFRVRTYTTVNGKKIYGRWTAVKSVKCK